MKITLKKNQDLSQAIMDDCGTIYYSPFEYTLDDEEDTYTGRVEWETKDAWDKGELNMDDESEACDWDVYTIKDEAGDVIENEEVKAMVEDHIG